MHPEELSELFSPELQFAYHGGGGFNHIYLLNVTRDFRDPRRLIDNPSGLKAGERYIAKVPKAQSLGAIDRANREVRNLRLIGENEYVVPYKGHLVVPVGDQGMPVILLEQGDYNLEEMRRILYKGRVIEEAIFVRVFEQMCLALRSIHTINTSDVLGFVHRDVKPSNFIFFKNEGRIKLCDAGSMGLLKEDPDVGLLYCSTTSGQGTVPYKPPEMISNLKHAPDPDVLWDVYSVSQTGVEFIMAKTLFNDQNPDSVKHIVAQKNNVAFLDETAHRLISEFRISEHVASALRSGMDPERRNRPKDMDELLSRIHNRDSPDFLAQSLSNLERLLQSSVPAPGKWTPPEVLDAAVSTYLRMEDYQKKHGAQSSATKRAFDLLTARAQVDYATVENDIKATTERKNREQWGETRCVAYQKMIWTYIRLWPDEIRVLKNGKHERFTAYPRIGLDEPAKLERDFDAIFGKKRSKG